MSTYNWNSASTTTISALKGDIISVNGISAAKLTVTARAGSFTLAGPAGALTVQCAEVRSPSDLALFLFDFLDGSMLGVATWEKDPEASLFDDQLIGSDADDTLQGNTGHDVLRGYGGDDALVGGAGNDWLDGGEGFNLLMGGVGDDTYIIDSPFNVVYDSAGNDHGFISIDFYKTDPDVEDWVWGDGLQKLPYWIDAITFSSAPVYAYMQWGEAVIQYSLAQIAPEWLDDDDSAGFMALNAAQAAYLRRAMDYISSVVNVTFREVPFAGEDDGYSIVIGNNTQDDSAGYANPAHPTSAGVLMLNKDVPELMDPARDDGDYFFLVILHELGHVLGLKHPFANGLPGSHPNEAPFLPDAEDNDNWTVMTYTDLHPDRGMVYSPFDIAALHYMYGPSASLAPGNDTYAIEAGRPNFIADGGGTDTITAAALAVPVLVDLNEGMTGQVGKDAITLASTSSLVTVNFATAIENAVGGSADDRLVGNALDNRLEGGKGNDYLWGGQGNDTLDGNAGTDTAGFQFDSTAYTLQQVGATLVVQANGASDRDVLVNIERLAFPDRMRAYDVDGNGGQLYRLYQASFDRAPDAAGIGFWLGQLDKGMDLRAIASGFIASGEFTTLYGANPTPEAFITRLYNNVLHRPYEQAGYDFWLAAMQQQGSTREDVLMAFTDSGENIALVNPSIAGGFWYLPA